MSPAPATIDAEISRIVSESVATKLRFLQESRGTLARVVRLVADAIRSRRKVLLFGNGGSAADAQHLAAEFTNRTVIERRPLPAIALTTDTSALTSIANDYGYDLVFAKQVAALGERGDVAIAISTSGESPNVVAALRVCREKGIHTVGLTGRDGGQMRPLVDHLLNVSATTKTPRIQETHIVAGHIICELVDTLLFGDTRERASRPRPARIATARTTARTTKRGGKTRLPKPGRHATKRNPVKRVRRGPR